MLTGTIFFSYSRDNSEFVLKLAKELRKTGAKIWLDQLDIKPGTRWDNSIEKALDNSHSLIVVLSKSAVESNNVMDEVSYAIEEGKTIYPLLLEECDVPFRLRRLQFADFTTDSAKGMATLLEALNINKTQASKIDLPKNSNNNNNKTKQVNSKSEKDNNQDIQDKLKSNISKKLIYISLLIVVIIAGGIWFFTRPNDDVADWKKIKDSNNFEAFNNHLEKYINGIHKEAAIAKIIKIRYDKQDNDDWKKIENNATLEDLNQHSENFPSCPHTPLINSKIKELSNTNKEKNNWKIAKAALTGSSVQKYITSYPNGMFVNEAKSLIKKLKSRNSVTADKADYDKIKNSLNIDTLEIHLKIFSNSVHKNLINKRIKEIKQDKASWKYVSLRTDARSFYYYIKENPLRLYLNEAKTKIYEIVKNKPIGYVYLGKSNSAKTSMSNTRNFDAFLGDSNSIPKVGDIIIAKRGINLRSTSTNTSRVIGNIKGKQAVVVLEIIPQGNTSFWVSVAKI